MGQTAWAIAAAFSTKFGVFRYRDLSKVPRLSAQHRGSRHHHRIWRWEQQLGGGVGADRCQLALPGVLLRRSGRLQWQGPPSPLNREGVQGAPPPNPLR